MNKSSAGFIYCTRNICISSCSYIFTVIFFTLLLSFFSSNNCIAQVKEFEYSDSSILQESEETKLTLEKPAEVITDTTFHPHFVSLPADSVAAWKGSGEYVYMNTLDSLLKRRMGESEESYQPVKQQNSPSFLQGLLSATIVKIIFWILAITAVGFLLYKLFLSKANLGKRQSGNPVTEVLPEEVLPIEMSDYDTLIRQSFLLEDYRMAVRYLFLRTLFVLNEKGVLQWPSEKTNFEYVQEMPLQKKNDFAKIVLNYEYVWYGHVKINREQFEQIENSYTQFTKKI